MSSTPSPARHRGLRLSVVSTGIGADNVGDRHGRDPGHHAAAHVRPHRLLWRRCARTSPSATWSSPPARCAWRSTTSYYVEDGYPAVADYAAVAALLEAAARTGHRAHPGLTATAPGFYGAQGRPIPQLPLRFPDLAGADGRAGRRQLRDGGLGRADAGGPGRLPRRRRLHRLRAAHQRRVRHRRSSSSWQRRASWRPASRPSTCWPRWTSSDHGLASCTGVRHTGCRRWHSSRATDGNLTDRRSRSGR